MIHSRWFRLVVIVVLMVAGGLFLWQYNQVDKPQLVNSDGRVFEKARVVDIVRDNLQEDGSRVGDQIVTLRMEDGLDAGQTVQANCPNGLLFGTVCQPGMAVIVISANVGAMGVLFLFFPWSCAVWVPSQRPSSRRSSSWLRRCTSSTVGRKRAWLLLGRPWAAS